MAALRIIHVALQLETGGMERLLVEFARHADRARFALRFVALGGRGPVAEEIEACGWPVTALGVNPGARPSTVFRLSRLFQEERPDLVHTHNTKPLLYAGPAARLAGVRGAVHTRHGQRHGASRNRMRSSAPPRGAPIGLSAYPTMRRRSAAPRGVRSGAVHRIWNGIDLLRFTYTGPKAGGPAVYVGRLTPEKDVGTLLRAVAIVIQRRPSFRLLIAGDGPARVELGTLAEGLKLGEAVEFLGEVRDIPSLLSRGSLFVLPSLTEGLPLTALEAMARGLPVVATSVGGTPEAVMDGSTGLLVAPGNEQALAEAMLRLSEGIQTGRAMGVAGRARVTDLFDARGMVHRYESLYGEVLTRRERLAA